jgi:hypothetical protein
MLGRLKCLLKGHQFTCAQVITLLPDNTAVLDHGHQCMRCPKFKQFPQEPVEDEMVEMLLAAVGQSRMPTTMRTDPPQNHKPLIN